MSNATLNTLEATMKYAIQNTSGQYWTGDCWGVRENRELYAADELPLALGDLELVDSGDPQDYCYSDPSEPEGCDVVASVYPE